MIIEKLSELPELDLTEYARTDWAKLLRICAEHKIPPTALFTLGDVWLLSDRVPTLVVGVAPGSLVGNYPELWVLACRNLRAKHLRELRELFHSIRAEYPALRVSVENSRGLCRFAEFFGFQPRRQTADYIIYEG